MKYGVNSAVQQYICFTYNHIYEEKQTLTVLRVIGIKKQTTFPQISSLTSSVKW